MNLDVYKKLGKDAGLPSGKLTNEYMFTLFAIDLFLFEKNIGVSDIQNGFVDGANDGGIDFIYSDDDSIFFIQGKSSKSLSTEDVINAFNKIIRSLAKLKKQSYASFSKPFVSSYLNILDSITDSASLCDVNIEIVLCSGSAISLAQRELVFSQLRDEEYSNYNFAIYDIDDIDVKFRDLQQERDSVKEDTLLLTNSGSILEYNEGSGFIANIKASSLKRLFQKHERRGLFSYNLREHITNKNVDDGINDTINKDKENFWFYNNGITIACSECVPDGNRIRLYNLSIINGAQTTTKIGQAHSLSVEKDFDLVCKIVVAKKGSLPDNVDFISRISQASNSQKPIIPRDLKANAKEQRNMQYNAERNKLPLAIEIKRGLRASNYSRVEKWQRIKNDEIGQIILGCILQRPGKARTGKREIFDSSPLYKQVFYRTMDYDTLYDLVKLSYYYEQFKIKFTKTADNVDLISVCKNGRFCLLAIVIYFLKKERGLIFDSTDDCLTKDNLSGTLIETYRKDDFEEKLDDFFTWLVTVLDEIYITNKNELQLTSHSNFFKTDKIYRQTILAGIEKKVSTNKWYAKVITDSMKIFDT